MRVAQGGREWRENRERLVAMEIFCVITIPFRTYAVEDECSRCCVGRSDDGTSYGTAPRPYTLNCVSPIL